MTNAILRGKPDAGNPHVRFDEGEVASAKPRRGSLLYRGLIGWLALGSAMSASALTLEVGAGRTYGTLDAAFGRVQEFRRANTNESVEIRMDAGEYPVPQGVWIGCDRARPDWGR